MGEKKELTLTERVLGFVVPATCGIGGYLFVGGLGGAGIATVIGSHVYGTFKKEENKKTPEGTVVGLAVGSIGVLAGLYNYFK